jgi:hypothetical protein
MFWAARALHWRSQRVPPWPKGPGNLVKLRRAGDRALQLLPFNEEFLVSAGHQPALITSLPFVHTARRYYRLNVSVRSPDWPRGVGDRRPGAGKLPKLAYLEEVKVVTRSPLVNQRRDHYRSILCSYNTCEHIFLLLRRTCPWGGGQGSPEVFQKLSFYQSSE